MIKTKLNILLWGALIVIATSCSTKETSEKITHVDSSKIHLYHVVNGNNTLFPGDVHDMILEYSKRDSLTVFRPTGEHYLKVFTTPQARFVIAFEQLNKVSAYRVEKNKPVKVFEDSLTDLDPQYVSVKDVNFDGYDDVVVANNQGAHGNLYSYVLLSKNGSFVHDSRFDLQNMELLPNQKQLRERVYSSACGAQSKSVFTVNGYTINLLKRVVIAPNCSNEEQTSTLYTTQLKNGKEVTDSLSINPDKAWDMFNLAIWSTRD